MEETKDMMNFHGKKGRKVLSTIIIIVLVLAMIVPLAATYAQFAG